MTITSNVQISGKANNGIIFVVGGEDVDALRVNLSALLGGMERADAVLSAATQLIVPPNAAGAPSRDEFQQAAQTVQNAFVGAASSIPDDPWGSPPVPPYQPQQNQQRQATPPPGQSAPACQHGARSWVTGTSKKNGKAWKMWACPADRDSQCEPVWVR